MTPYVWLLATVVVVAHLGRRSNGWVGRSLSVTIACLLLIVFAGVRDFRVGTDTGNYVYSFLQVDSLQSALSMGTEVGYGILVWSAKAFSESYASLLVLVATLVVPLYVTTIVRLVDRYETGIYLFVAFGLYTFAFNGARQAIAAAICFWAIRFILDRRLLPYLAAVGIAFMFHKTALVAMPLYFLATAHLRMFRFVAVLAAITLIMVFLQDIVGLAADLIDDRYSSYANEGEGGGVVIGTFLLSQGVVLLWLRRFIRIDFELYSRLLNIYLIGIVPVVVSIFTNINPSGLLRLNIYFTSMSVLLWPIVFRNIHDTRQRATLGFFFLLFTIVFFFMTTTTFSDLVPYQLNGDLF